MEAIIVARYAPLLLPQPLNALPADGSLKKLPRFIGDPSGFFEMTMVEFYLHAFINHWET
jgi:hypothetical protein